MKQILTFAAQFQAQFSLNADALVKKGNRYFLLKHDMEKFTQNDFYYAGTYLGEVKNGLFFPSFNLLTMLARAEANRIVVDKKTAWLFICGRDVFRKGIKSVQGSLRRGSYVLVLNEFGECLGFGKATSELEGEKARVAVKNVLDLGDFLRREA